MKIYHTETQEDYDALMVELKRLGIETIKKHLWKENDNQTVVFVRAIGRYIDNRTDTTFGGLARTLKNYPRVPIIKYKAKEDNEMKIYHTETQEDYDALMVELEKQGFAWWNDNKKPTEKNYWHENKKKTCVRTIPEGKKMLTKSKEFYIYSFPGDSITKYKAKADEKMRFTKENVYRLFGDYRRGKNGINRLDNLESVIMDLDDTPEKVAVPKFVADYLEERKRDGDGLFPSLYHFQDNFEDWAIKDWIEEEENNVSFARAWLDGYTIEPEQLYYIPLPDLETSDGLQQVLSKRKGDKHYFASRPNEKLQQRYTKEELEQVPEIYKPYAKPIEEEEK